MLMGTMNVCIKVNNKPTCKCGDILVTLPSPQQHATSKFTGMQEIKKNPGHNGIISRVGGWKNHSYFKTVIKHFERNFFPITSLVTS